MKHFMRPALAILLMTFGLLMLVHIGFADSPAFTGEEFTNPRGTSDGKTAAELSGNLYCQTKNLLEGQLGVLVGLALVFIGIWNLINGKGWFSAILAILSGAIIPYLPGLVEGFMIGYRDLMTQSGLSTEQHSLDFSGLRCNGDTLIDNQATLEELGLENGSDGPPSLCIDSMGPC